MGQLLRTLGEIGTAVAKGASLSFGMNIVVWGREVSLDRAKTLWFKVAQSKEDVLSIQIRYNSKDTNGIIKLCDNDNEANFID